MDNKYKPVPFWSWNDELDEKELCDQIQWMYDQGIGGFFMHARGGLTTPYLGEKWFKCIEACLKKAKELNMEGYAYDENGWPSGFAGGILLDDELNRDMYLSHSMGEYDPNAAASFEVGEKEIKRVTSGDNVLNVYTHISTSTADVCNKDVVRKFINLTHEQYKKHDIYGNLRGFFTDEPQYYRWGTSFTRVLPDYFKKKYGEDIFDRIGLLFVKKEGYEDYRYKYFKSLQELMLNAYAKQIYEWCDQNGYKFTGHYVEEQGIGKQILCCGGVMPFYEYEHIPGIDHLGRPSHDNISARQLGSVMAQLDKRQGLCEMFACAGWDATPLELKKIAEYYMVNGVNVLCHHLLPYKEHGQRKRDYPEHYSNINPWVEVAFKDFNDHFSNIAELLANSKEVAFVGVFMPIRSGYFTYNRDMTWDEDYGCLDITNNLLDISNQLSKNGVMFHYLDETVMAKHGSVEGATLKVGQCSYKYIVIPEGTLTMDKSTMELFKQYASNGGKFLVVKDVPQYLEGQRFDHSYMKNNCSLEDIIKDKPYISSYNENIRLAYRQHDNGEKFLYLFNLGDETEIHIEVPEFKSFKCKNEILGQDIHFDKSESKILQFSNEEPIKKPANELLTLNKEFKVVGSPLNYLTIDYIRYSKDDVIYTEPMHYMAIFNLLLQEKYEGDLYLKYEFDSKYVPKHVEALIEDTHIQDVFMNNKVMKKDGIVLEKDLWKYNVSNAVKAGHNELVVKIRFFESNQVYYVLYGENVLESLRNCLVYDTTIEPIYLRGDFGVYGDFEDHGETAIANKFYVDTPKSNVNCLIMDGYPFFRGTISLEQNIKVDSVNKTLCIPERFQLIDLYVNDQFVKRMMFDYKVDLSKHLKIGDNKIRLDLVVSNRNLLGPHHHQMEEPMFVGPHTFERFKTWNEKGESPWCLPRYSFVKTII